MLFARYVADGENQRENTFLEHLENRPWITGVNIQCSFKIAFQKSADLSPRVDEFHSKQKEKSYVA